MKVWQYTGPVTHKDGTEHTETQFLLSEEQPHPDAVERPRIPEPDEVWDGAGWLLPVAVAQSRCWEKVKALRHLYHYGTAPTPYGSVQCDPEAKANVTGLALMATIAKGAGVAFSEPFTLADNSVVVLDADQMIGLSLAVGQHVSAVFARARALRDQIAAATSAAEVEAIDIEAGWPGL